jgi:hypothetical protein
MIDFSTTFPSTIKQEVKLIMSNGNMRKIVIMLRETSWSERGNSRGDDENKTRDLRIKVTEKVSENKLLMSAACQESDENESCQNIISRWRFTGV